MAPTVKELKNKIDDLEKEIRDMREKIAVLDENDVEIKNAMKAIELKMDAYLIEIRAIRQTFMDNTNHSLETQKDMRIVNENMIRLQSEIKILHKNNKIKEKILFMLYGAIISAIAAYSVNHIATLI